MSKIFEHSKQFTAYILFLFSVGKKVITKAIENRSALDHMDNDDDYEDITSNYKYAEGSASERLTMMSAAKSVGGNAMRRRRVEKADGDSARGDVDFVMADLEQEEYGKPYSVTLGVHVSQSWFVGLFQRVFAHHFLTAEQEWKRSQRRSLDVDEFGLLHRRQSPYDHVREGRICPQRPRE